MMPIITEAGNVYYQEPTNHVPEIHSIIGLEHTGVCAGWGNIYCLLQGLITAYYPVPSAISVATGQ